MDWSVSNGIMDCVILAGNWIMVTAYGEAKVSYINAGLYFQPDHFQSPRPQATTGATYMAGWLAGWLAAKPALEPRREAPGKAELTDWNVFVPPTPSWVR